MKTTILRNWRPADILIAFAVLTLLFSFTFALLFVAPFPGFYFNPFDGKVLEIYKNGKPGADLKVGDFIESIGRFTLDDYRNDKSLDLFENIQAGQTIEIVVRRNGEIVRISWVYAGFNTSEFLGRFFNVWWLAYIFWGFALSTQLFIRPKDARWRLLAAVNHLIAIFIILGSATIWPIWGSSTLLRVVAWITLPVYIQLHWIFPSTIKPIPKWIWGAFYVVSFGLALGEVFLPFPRFLYFLALILALGGSMMLLIIRFIFHANERREVRFLIIAGFIALFPTISISLAGSNGQMPVSGPLSLVALPILPGAYFYILHRHRLGGLELRANRAMSLYVFLTLLGTALLIGVGYSGLVKVSQEALAFASVLIALAATFAGILTFPSFQSFIERRLLGIKLPAQSLVADYSARIVTSTTLSGLLRLLEEEVFPSLLVRQYAFVQVANASAKNLLSKNVTQDQVREDAMRDLAASVPTDRLIRFPEEEQPLGWVRLILLLRIGSDPIGAWLLGRRDPDDLYPQVEFPILQSLANQTAVALSNILQTERLQRMYEDDIERNEKSRQLLALDLHDSVLNQLAVLHVSVDPAHASEKFENAYKEVTSRLREIVSNLRPPMLTYGLKPVIEELADNLMDRRDNTIHVVTRIEAVDGARYAENVELHLFRIIQEACENALRHGHATEIKLSAELAPEHIRLCIEDNGIGFETGGQIELDLLQANKHFGLSGMLERAMLIGATVEIRSSPGHGTEVRVVWNKANSTR